MTRLAAARRIDDRESSSGRVRPARRSGGEHGRLLALQRSAGNRAVLSVLSVQRRGGPEEGCGCASCSSTEKEPRVQRAVQGRQGTPVVQREDKAGDRVDVAIVLDQSSDNMVEASSLAPGRAFRALTKEAFAKKLKELSDANVPIGTLFIISHAAVGAGTNPEEGVVFFEPAKGTLQRVPLPELSKAVSNELPNGMSGKPEQIAFRGCRIGNASSSSLDAFRLSVGAGVAHGTNCKTVIRTAGPVSVGGKDIKSEKDLPTEEHKRVFDAEFLKMVTELDDGHDARHSVRNCIVGLDRGESALAAIDKLKRIYFQNKGELAAVWTNPDGKTVKDPAEPGCKCMNALDVGQGKCQLVQVPAAQPKPPGKQPGKTSCVTPSGPVFTLASFSTPTAAPDSAPAAVDAVDSDLVGLTRGDGITFGTTERRPRVERLQTRLNERGGALAPDGMFGGQTADAVHQLQGRIGVPAQDTVDPATAAALEGEPTPGAEISRLEGLRHQDGITFGTWHLRPRVGELQQRLTSHGFVAEPDGMFGNDTLTALNAFQATHELTPSVVVDRATADALEGRTIAPQCPPGQVPVPDLVEV